MAHTARKPEDNTTTEAERFLENANKDLRNARIRGITDIKTAQEFVAHENNREEPREHVLEMLEERAKKIRSD